MNMNDQKTPYKKSILFLLSCVISHTWDIAQKRLCDNICQRQRLQCVVVREPKYRVDFILILKHSTESLKDQNEVTFY